MLEILSWLFNLLGSFVSLLLTFHIIGDLSFLHIIIGAIFIYSLLNLVTLGGLNFSNSENSSDKKSSRKEL